jgi:hypothetical protein
VHTGDLIIRKADEGPQLLDFGCKEGRLRMHEFQSTGCS